MDSLIIDDSKAVIATRNMKKFLSDLLTVNIIRPENINNTQSLLYRNVWNQRTRYYQAKAPHLLDPNERATELCLDEKGLIFTVSSSNQLLASLRLVKRPFEIESFQTSNLDFRKFENYWEIGRLVNSPEVDQISLAMITQYLLCVSGLELFTTIGCDGLIGICKPATYKFFSKFGMNIIGTAYSESRDITYHMIKGDIQHILSSTENIIIHQMRIHKRLSLALG